VSVVGFVVAGGGSRRMGRDKALVPWAEGDLLGHALARLRAVTGDIRILCGPEPLCAVYGPACLEPVRRLVAAGDLRMTSFWPEVRVREVRPPELAAFGDPAALFHNVNTPADLPGPPPAVSGR
jgi:molybdopterin-guanine dinucleotide biosynthesis protein A